MRKGRTDIIIVNLNGKHYLQQCLPSIREHSNRVPYQLVVVDNGSTDGSVKWVESHFPRAKVIKNQENLGFSKACNQGIQVSDGEYILLLNNDTEFRNDVLGAMIQFFEEHEDAALVGPLICYPDGEVQASAKHFPTVWKFVLHQLGLTLLFVRDRKIYYPFGPFRLADYRDSHPVEWLSGACLMFKRKVFNQAGALEERMPFGFEDMDYARRTLALGYKNYFTPLAQIVHHKGGTHQGHSGKQDAFTRVAYRKGIDLYFRKYHSKPAYLIVYLSMLIGRLPRLLKLLTRSYLRKITAE